MTSEQILQAVNMAVEMHKYGDDATTVPAYRDDNVSTKVVVIWGS